MVDEYAGYNSTTTYMKAVGTACYSCNDHSIKLQNAYQVNSLGGLHSHLMESDPVPPIR